MHPRSPFRHRAAMAAVLGLALLTLSDAHGQSDSGRVIPRDPGMETPKGDDGMAPRRDRDPGNVIKRERDASPGDSGRTTKKAKRAGKRTWERVRRGVSPVDG